MFVNFLVDHYHNIVNGVYFEKVKVVYDYIDDIHSWPSLENLYASLSKG